MVKYIRNQHRGITSDKALFLYVSRNAGGSEIAVGISTFMQKVPLIAQPNQLIGFNKTEYLIIRKLRLTILV